MHVAGIKPQQKAQTMKAKAENNIITIDHAPHTVVDIEPDERSNISVFVAVELTHASLHSI